MKNQEIEIPREKLLQLIGELYVQARINGESFSQIITENKKLKTQISEFEKENKPAFYPD